EFKNKVVDGYLEKNGIYHTTAPPYHPQANPVERVNRTIKTMIVACLEESHDKWDEHLHEVVFAFNTADQSSLGVSPAVLNYGRQPDPPNSEARRQRDASMAAQQEEAVESWADRVRKLPELQARAAESATKEQERQARY
ncbi:hypothetical protein JGE30_24560, partial [Salmonella enterica subsp. enterica serovar Give]|nr:hypothetical protein [Salmonella enterica subsp. enterica serovar Give]